ncbi:uncharacterized protein LOC125240337 [Leguminivora glycinivorella]|uniref:uncharacterized protein LOC125240337 n=1 Tax=Leguminivora glycinivorella TaxID=1035111 RepID=UPI00200C34C4|nr:uncharacterized protein LOC125240337 [Leguminivora glycinivorella]
MATKTSSIGKHSRYFTTVTPERFSVLRNRFDQFLVNLDKDVPVIQVYDQLRQEQLEQLAVIREVSQTLQQKKDDDILKAKQAAEEAQKKAEADAKKKKEESKEGEQEVKEDKMETVDTP